MSSQQNTIAVFIDFENLALGYKGQGRFEIQIVLKRLLEKGKIVAKKAYCDWSRFRDYTPSLHDAACELIEIPKRGQTGKNSADIRLCVDAMDLAYSKDHIDTFVIVSGDSDFSPLVSKLKELGKHVIGLGMTASTSGLLRDNCDEFIYYETLITATPQINTRLTEGTSDAKHHAFTLLFEGLQALRRENREVLASPLVKQTLLRMHPGFSESQYGFRNWGALLVDAQKEGLIELTTDPRNGNFVITKFGEELKSASITPAPELQAPSAEVARAPLSRPSHSRHNSTAGRSQTRTDSRAPSAAAASETSQQLETTSLKTRTPTREPISAQAPVAASDPAPVASTRAEEEAKVASSKPAELVPAKKTSIRRKPIVVTPATQTTTKKATTRRQRTS